MKLVNNEVLKIEEIMEDMEGDFEEVYRLTDYNLQGGSYICDIITEIADMNVPVYTGDLLDQVKKLYFEDWIDEALFQLGNCNDFTQLISYASFLKETQKLYDNLEDMILYAALYITEDEIIKNISEDQLKLLQDELEQLDYYNSQLFDIYDLVYQFAEDNLYQ